MTRDTFRRIFVLEAGLPAMSARDLAILIEMIYGFSWSLKLMLTLQRL
jgi:hypothetical protein